MTPPLPDAPTPPGAHLLDARLHLLDRQLLDADDEPIGIVDDLEFDDAAAPRITAILTGRVLFTRIFGGQPPRSRLQALPWHLVARIGTSVHLRRTEQAVDGLWVEHWLRDHIIGRIPGGRRAAQ